jgi:phosphoribosylformylglycinamidine cyclo-ligase
LIQEEDGTRSISDEEMYRVFNMGIGMVLIVTRDAAEDAAATLSDMGEQVYEIGEVRPGQGVTFVEE